MKIACAFLLTILVTSAARAQPTPAASSRSGYHADHLNIGDLICGPRCVAYILGYYGQPNIDIVALVRETQWPNIEAGASMADLEKSLNARGVYTRAIKLGVDDILDWGEPVLLHTLVGRAKTGHFAVWLPPRTPGRHTVWLGLGGTIQGRWVDVTDGATGYALLTSSKPIPTKVKAIANDRRMTTRLGYAAVALSTSILLCELFGCVLLMRRGVAAQPLSPTLDSSIITDHKSGST